MGQFMLNWQKKAPALARIVSAYLERAASGDPDQKKALESKIGMVLGNSASFPTAGDLLLYYFWYVTSDEPYLSAHSFIDEGHSSGENGALLALHNHSSHEGTPFSDAKKGDYPYGTGSDGADSLHDMILHAANDTAINVYAATDHASNKDVITGRSLFDDGKPPFGVSLGDGAVKAWKDMQRSGDITRKDFAVVKGTELLINGLHLVALNLDYQDMDPLFEEVLGERLPNCSDPAHVHAEFCDKLDEVGLRAGHKKILAYMKAIPDVFVVSVHPRTVVAGAGSNYPLADATEVVNGEGIVFTNLPRPFIEENDLDVMRPAVLYCVAMPVLDRLRAKKGKAPEIAAISASDAHSLEMIPMCLTAVPGLTLEEVESYSAYDDPSEAIATRLKSEAAGKGADAFVSGINRSYLDPLTGGPDFAAIEDVTKSYFKSYGDQFGSHVDSTIGQWGFAKHVLGPLGSLASDLRGLYQDRIKPSKAGPLAERLVDRLAEKLGIYEAVHYKAVQPADST